MAERREAYRVLVERVGGRLCTYGKMTMLLLIMIIIIIIIK
jgi:hypothetical protein